MAPLTGAVLWLWLAAIGTLWGAAFPLIRWLTPYLPPLPLAALRGLVTAAVLLPFLLWWRERGAAPSQGALWRAAFVLGLLSGAIPNTLIPLALARMEAAPAALVQASGPLMVALLAPLLLPGERPGWRSFAGLGLGFAGIALIVGEAGFAGGSGSGVLLMLAATFSYSLSTVWARWAARGDPAALAFGQQAVSGAVTGGLAVAVDGPGVFLKPPEVWGVVLLLAVFATALPLTLFLALLARARAAEAALVGYLQPVSAALLAALWLGEVPQPRVVLGGAVVLLGVALVTARR